MYTCKPNTRGGGHDHMDKPLRTNLKTVMQRTQYWNWGSHLCVIMYTCKPNTRGGGHDHVDKPLLP